MVGLVAVTGHDAPQASWNSGDMNRACMRPARVNHRSWFFCPSWVRKLVIAVLVDTDTDTSPADSYAASATCCADAVGLSLVKLSMIGHQVGIGGVVLVGSVQAKCLTAVPLAQNA